MAEKQTKAELAERRRKHAAYMREYTKRNREKVNAQRRARRSQKTLESERRWKQANREKVLEYKRRDREKRRAYYARYKREWAKRNAAHITARRRREYRAKKREIQARIDAAHKADPEGYRARRVASSQRRRARLAQARIEPIDRNAIYERDGGVCALCGKHVVKSQMSLDHIQPLSLGGDHVASNIQLAHINCNKARGTRGSGQFRLPL